AGRCCMSFMIHAAGPFGFYTRYNQVDGDIFQAARVASTLLSLEPSVSGVISAGADQVAPSVSAIDALETQTNSTFIQLLRDEVNHVAHEAHSAEDGWIAVATRVSRSYWADEASFARFYFRGSTDPGTDFIMTILPALTETGFNNFGVFQSMYRALNAYRDHMV